MRGLPILTADAMRAAEQAVFAVGTPEYDVMQRAGAACAEVIWRAGGHRDTLVLCGPGNNGGDGFVIARLLRERGVKVRVAALGDSRTASSSKARAAWNGPVEPLAQAGPATLLVDALFGTGLTRGLDAPVAGKLLELVEASDRSYAVDLPSGVATDGGAHLSPVPHFDCCIALGALKPAHVLYPAAGSFRSLICADIGVPALAATAHVLAPPELSAPGFSAHKYSRGFVAMVAGGMAGAAVLATTAAARGGAGAVRHLAAHPSPRLPDAAIVIARPSPADIAPVLDDDRLGAVLIGPGLGRDEDAVARLRAALECGHPLVIDADAITLAARLGIDALPAGAILTPHDGEFDRLFGTLPGSKIDKARKAASLVQGVVVYKGADTVIADPDGRVAVASHGSSWLSTAGTGDVLAGLCAARLAATRHPFRAACEAVWLHGEAARRAGPAFVADDLAQHIGAAIASRL